MSKHITQQIVVGMILLALSGTGWLFLGLGLAPCLNLKLALFGAIWVVGPVIDHVVEPRFQRQATRPGGFATPAFASALRRYLASETIATSLFYVIWSAPHFSWTLFGSWNEGTEGGSEWTISRGSRPGARSSGGASCRSDDGRAGNGVLEIRAVIAQISRYWSSA